MSTSYNGGSSGFNYSQGEGSFISHNQMLPLCNCKLPMAMVMYIAGTRKNYGRRFWRCPRWQTRPTCDMFVWDDDLVPGSRPMVDVNRCVSSASIGKDKEAEIMKEKEVESSAAVKCNCEVEKEKVKTKWKTRWIEEKKKVDFLKGMLVLSWFLFVAILSKKMM
ncbi:hypothetical protein P8452_50573 [Trifolium repens]|nr:hypothetical protein P8452_50573 [Trifolium repens]